MNKWDVAILCVDFSSSKNRKKIWAEFYGHFPIANSKLGKVRVSLFWSCGLWFSGFSFVKIRMMFGTAHLQTTGLVFHAIFKKRVLIDRYRKRHNF
jgi:hypothetical protein